MEVEEAHARRSPAGVIGGLVRAILVLSVGSALLVSACSSKAQIVTAPPASENANATPIATGASAGDMGTYPLGAGVTVGGANGVTVRVIKFERNPPCSGTTPASGTALVGVSVDYVPVAAGVPYALTDWTAHDDAGAAIVPQATCFKDVLGSGTTAPNSAQAHTAGWIVLQVPTSSQHVWVTYTGAGGTKVGWQVY